MDENRRYKLYSHRENKKIIQVIDRITQICGSPEEYWAGLTISIFDQGVD